MKSSLKEFKYGKQNINDVFSEWYTVPSYQRHYVWEDDHICKLLDDIKDNYITHSTEEYFLGSYIIQSKARENDLLDGQQRITTLFLLFAFLRDYKNTPLDWIEECQNLIYQKAQKRTNTPARVRLKYEIRGEVGDFIEKKIVPEDGITNNWKEFCDSKVKKNESVSHICSALLCFKNYFDSNTDIDIDKFLDFICNNVVLIYISADTLEDAFRLFSIMNDRGVKLANADILKSSNLEKLTDKTKLNYIAQQWEDKQESLGADFDRFLSYVRTILLKTRQRSNLLDEYENFIFKKGVLKQGEDFFEKVFSLYDTYDKSIDLTGNNNMAYCNLIRIMKASMPSTDWIPVVMCYYEKYKDTNLIEFTKKLACKTVADAVCGVQISKRIDDLGKLMKCIEDSQSSQDVLDNSNLFEFQQEIFKEHISSDIYGRQYAKALLMLLEYKYQDNTIPKEFSKISIEHILPQNPKATSQWCKDFSDDDRTNTTHKIGNLCIIGSKKNTALGNLDSSDKREKYFKNNIGNFARTLKIYNDYPTQWTLKEYNLNQEKTIQDIKDFFEVR